MNTTGTNISRSNKNKSNNSKLSIDKTLYCTRCGNSGDFYIGKSDLYKFYEKIPFCKKCIEEIYNELVKIHSDYKKAIYFLCRKLDIPFKNTVYDGAVKESSIKGWSIQQTYMKQINSFSDKNNYGTCFDDSDLFDNNSIDNGKSIVSFDISEYEQADESIKLFWGFGFSDKDYAFLEQELFNWKQTHKCDNQSEITLLREICITILEIRNVRADKNSTKDLKKELQDLMKTASVDPAKANAASAGKSLDAFGIWIKDIEQFTPAEWYEQQEKYKDMDGFIPYIKNYIIRPIENFITGIRNFVVDDNIDVDLDSVDVGNSEGDSNG